MPSSTRKNQRPSRKGKPSTAKSSTSSTLQNIINSEAQKLSDQYSTDGEFDPSQIHRDSGPEFSRNQAEAHEERVIDALLASVPSSKGYYMKIHKEIGPGQYEYKLRINDYETWSDFEYEIANLVQFMTKKEPRKWGSGTYRVTIWNEHGMRGDGYQPQFFHIDAGEFSDIHMNTNGNGSAAQTTDPAETFRENVNMFGNLMNAMKGFMPPQSNPGETQKHIADAFTQGMSMKQNDGQSQALMMTTMMTGMMGMMEKLMTQSNTPKDVTPQKDPVESLNQTIAMMKNMGVIGQPQHSLKDSIVELQTMGIDPFKQNDTMSQVKQIKDIADLLQGFMGAGSGERPGIAEKLVDVLVPAIPGIISNITDLSNNYTQGKGRTVLPVVPQAQLPTDSYQHNQPMHNDHGQHIVNGSSLSEPVVGGIGGGPAVEQPAHPSPPSTQNSQSTGIQGLGEPDMLVQLFFSQLLSAIRTHNVEFFPQLTQTMMRTEGGEEILRNLINGSMQPEALETLIQQWGGAAFVNSDVIPFTQTYVQQYIQWLRTQSHAQINQPFQQNSPEQKQSSQTVQEVNGNVAELPQQNPKVQYNENGNKPLTVKSEVLGVCTKCGAEYEYDSLEHIQQEAGTCEEIMQETGERCNGIIEYVEVAHI